MALYNEKEQACLETDTMGVSPGASILQAKDRMQFPKDEAPVNMALWSILK